MILFKELSYDEVLHLVALAIKDNLPKSLFENNNEIHLEFGNDNSVKIYICELNDKILKN